MDTLLPSAYMDDDHNDDRHLIQALRDYGLQAPWEWQKLFLGLAERLENYELEKTDALEEAKLEGIEEGREAGEALRKKLTTIGEGIAALKADGTIGQLAEEFAAAVAAYDEEVAADE